MDDGSRIGKLFARAIAPGIAALLLAGPALAVDGVIEINQARALAGSITPGDSPNFPVDINSSGSYRLTGDLQVPSGGTGIFLGADGVTIDLNGFSIVSSGGVLTDGFVLSGHQNIEIKNGTVRGFTRYGIFGNATAHFIRLTGVRLFNNVSSGAELQGGGNLIENCTAVGNGIGFRGLAGTLVVDSIARNNSGVGIHLDQTGGYRSNVLTGNNGGDAQPQVGGGAGAIQLGTNVCGTDTVCP